MESEDFYKECDKEGLERRFAKNLDKLGDIELYRQSVIKELTGHERKILQIKHTILAPMEVQLLNIKDNLRFIDEKILDAKLKFVADQISKPKEESPNV